MVQFLVFVFPCVRILAALYRGLWVCVSPRAFSVSTDGTKAIGSPHSEHLSIGDGPADDALFRGRAPGTALHVLCVWWT